MISIGSMPDRTARCWFRSALTIVAISSMATGCANGLRFQQTASVGGQSVAPNIRSNPLVKSVVRRSVTQPISETRATTQRNRAPAAHRSSGSPIRLASAEESVEPTWISDDGYDGRAEVPSPAPILNPIPQGVDVDIVDSATDVVSDELVPEPMYGCPFGPTWRPPGTSGIWPPDEYLCDGGDRQGAVEAWANGQLVGVDPQDTVAHVRSARGGEQIVESNCVCIYAPRFGAVRHLTGIQTSDQRFRLSTLDAPEETVEQVGRDGAKSAAYLAGAAEGILLQPPIEASQRDGGDIVTELRGPQEDAFYLRLNENLERLLVHESAGSAKLAVADAALAAIQWTDRVAVQMAIEQQEVVAQLDYEPVQQTYQYETPPGRPCLKLVKLASRGQAQPGDEIAFLIRFRNTSPDTLEHVMLVDNLTTRLEYISGSQECSLDAQFASQENQGGSLVLKWRLDEPLPSGAEGVIHFRCRVR